MMSIRTEPDLSERQTRGRGAPHWLRWLLPALLIVAWLGAGSIGGPYFGRVDEVSSNDATSYLPTSADATRVQALLPEFSGGDAIPAIVLFTAERGIGKAQLAEIGSAAEEFAGLGAVSGEAVAELRTAARGAAPDGV